MSGDSRGETKANPVQVAPNALVPKLVAIAGPSTGRAFALERTMATVGRHPTNDFVVEDPRVSGTHLELTRVGDRVHLRDVGSTNGTWLGPHRITDAELAVGAQITVGDSVLRFDVDRSIAPPALSNQEAFGQLVGRSTTMRELFATLERIAAKDLAVLVQGETGTSKEEIARALHSASNRKDGPFIVVDATSLPETLSEALFLGNEKGAFPGANEQNVGFFEAARGGTVFLDNVGELSSALQAKLLRVLERREVVRVGGRAPVPIDVRVIASTNHDLRNAIDKGRFREDLYFRLAQVRLLVPPLRQRPEDLPLICARLLARSGNETMIDVDALDRLAGMPWPGNVRELNNVLLRAAALAQDGVIRHKDVAGEGDGFRGAADERNPLDLSGSFADAKERAIERFERSYLTLLMKRCQGNLSAAARQADVARHHLRDLLKKRGLYGVSRDDG